MLQSDAVRVGVVRSGYLAPDDGLAMATIHSTDDSHPADRAPAPRDDNLGSVISWKGVAAGAVTALVISLSLGRLTADALETNLGAQAAMLMVAMFIGSSIDGGDSFSPQTFLNTPNTVKDAITGRLVTRGPIPDNQSSHTALAEAEFGFGTLHTLADAGDQLHGKMVGYLIQAERIKRSFARARWVVGREERYDHSDVQR